MFAVLGIGHMHWHNSQTATWVAPGDAKNTQPPHGNLLGRHFQPPGRISNQVHQDGIPTHTPGRTSNHIHQDRYTSNHIHQDGLFQPHGLPTTYARMDFQLNTPGWTSNYIHQDRLLTTLTSNCIHQDGLPTKYTRTDTPPTTYIRADFQLHTYTRTDIPPTTYTTYTRTDSRLHTPGHTSTNQDNLPTTYQDRLQTSNYIHQDFTYQVRSDVQDRLHINITNTRTDFHAYQDRFPSMYTSF